MAKYKLEIELPDSFTGTEDMVRQLDSPWAFVEAFLPGYEHRDDVAWDGDLQKLADGEYEEGDCAHKLLVEEYDGDISHPDIEKDLRISNAKLYEDAIQGFISSIQKVELVKE